MLWRVFQVSTRADWRVTDISKSRIVLPSKDKNTGFLKIGMYEMANTDDVYWLAPALYNGNLLKNYGSELVFNIAWVVIRGDTSGQETSGPTIIVIGRNGMKIAYGDDIFRGSNATIQIPLLEDDWYHVPEIQTEIVTRLRRTEYHGDQVTRFQYMSVFSDVDTILLRGSFHTDQVESIFIDAMLNEGNLFGSHRSNLVEQCDCSDGYSGLSCEKCAFGFARVFDNSSIHERIAKCLRCSCNGHAATCDLKNDKCGLCEHNTFGDRYGFYFLFFY